jgi:hypothetical protein
MKLSRKAVVPHSGRRRDTHRGVHGCDRQQIGRNVLLDLLRDIDGLSLVAKRRQDFNDTSWFARLNMNGRSGLPQRFAIAPVALPVLG